MNVIDTLPKDTNFEREIYSQMNIHPGPYIHVFLHIQCRIQDFREVGAPTLQGEPTYDFAKFSQNCMKLKVFGPGGGGRGG